MSWEKIFGREINRKTISWADDLAIITAKNTVSHRFSIFNRNRTEMFDSEVRDTFPCIYFKGGNDRICRAGFDTSGALSAMISNRFTGNINTFGEKQFAEKEK